MDNFNALVMEEIDNKAVNTIATHPRDLLDRALYATNRVFVSKDPDEDSESDKLNATASLLENLAVALRDPANPMRVKYAKDGDGNYNGTISFKIPTEYAKTDLIPEVFIERSRSNRIKKAAKKMAG